MKNGFKQRLNNLLDELINEEKKKQAKLNLLTKLINEEEERQGKMTVAEQVEAIDRVLARYLQES